jgi:hypothetical protein
MKQVAVTTEDNPFNPITDFDRWYVFDTQKGYNTCAYLARITHYWPGMTEEEELLDKERAVDEICHFNLTGNYKKIVVGS